ncbi:MAG: hypothetical protein EXS37_04050 [Opitutus sp.]|nr:hypothetical protein [Opitutus sp.]
MKTLTLLRGFAITVGLSCALRAADPIHLFAFDDHALPFKDNLKLTYVSPQKHPANPVLRPGPVGSVDAVRTQFYGSVLREGGKFRMWYCALAGTETKGNVSTSARLAYAESDDGVRWLKPELGLMELNGSRRNNLLGMPTSLDFTRTEPLSCFVLHEPDDPDPTRRYKMAVYGRYYPGPDHKHAPGVSAENVPSTIYPFFSANGLTWTLAVPAPKNHRWFDESEAPIRVRNNFELGGLYKFDGLYYAAGQELTPDVILPDGSIVRRTMVTHWSGDFVHWSQDKSFSFQRYGYRGPRESLQEAHEPAGVWHRGNVLIGLYGQWHGAVITSERRMDLGLLVSNDGIHFREPIADRAFIPAGPDGAWDERGLIHGQGYENVGDLTYIYYGNWDISGVKTGYGTGAVGLATLPRDRLAGLSTRDPGEGGFTSQPIANPRPRTLFVNADGLSEDAFLRIELIDKNGGPVAGYAGAAAARVKQSGLKTLVTWAGGAEAIRCANTAYRVRVALVGSRAGEINFYVAYLE